MEAFDEVMKEYIDFVKHQVGAYMDALAGFAGHHTRVKLQVHRANRPVKSYIDGSGQRVVVWASYEDPSKPDIVHNRIIRADDYLAANAKGGSNEQQHAKAVLIFLYTYWEDEIRPRLASSRGVDVKEIRSDIMGDLRIIRNIILHAKSIVRADKHGDLKRLGQMFVVDQPLQLSYEGMHRIFVLLKQDCGRMLFEWLGVRDAPLESDHIADIALHLASQRRRA
jgi:hypothetical protein